MENRKPLQLRKVIVIYNFLQVVFSAWLFWNLGASGWFTNYSLRCQPVDLSHSAQALRVSFDCTFNFDEIIENISGKIKEVREIKKLYIIYEKIEQNSMKKLEK